MGRGITALNAMTFVLGWLAVVCALLPPLDELGERLVSLHMEERLALTLFAVAVLGASWQRITSTNGAGHVDCITL